MLSSRHTDALANIKEMFRNAGVGYDLSFKMLNASNFDVPQDRKRVFFIGTRKDLGINFKFPLPKSIKINLKETIGDLQGLELPALPFNKTNGKNCKILNHEYMIGGFSSMFMSRNRVRAWDEQSFTIQAGGRHAPLHPQAPKMQLIEQDKRAFVKGSEKLYRRLTVRECARIQTFPDDFEFLYTHIAAGYKMIGNAVPVNLAKHIALSIKSQIQQRKKEVKKTLKTNALLKPTI